MNQLMAIAVLLASGLLLARLCDLLNFPHVTGYLIAGVLIGPSVFGLVSAEAADSLYLINEVALGFIAFSIGSQMNLRKMRSLGSKILIVTLAEAIGAFVVVTLVLVLFGQPWSFALVLGSIASATAPAATLMVIRQYRAKGELVDLLIPVVALDDAVCIMIFGIASSLATALVAKESLNAVNMLVLPLAQILLAFVVGGLIGLLTLIVQKRLRSEAEVLALTIAVVLGGAALALILGISSLLTLMATGLVVTNLGRRSRIIEEQVDKITPPIFICFFVLSGADLKLSSLAAVGGIGACYVIGRVIGKMSGAYLSTRLVGFSEEIQQNLGLTLIPQAGVALALSAIAELSLPAAMGGQIRTIILAATIIYELVGPFVAKMALKRAGCIEPAVLARHEEQTAS